MSLVEVSPSTVIWLNVAGTTSASALRSTAGSAWTSVVINSSIVAMLGWIMPDPLAMAPMRQGLPPSVNSTAYSLGWVSVVMMAVAAAWLPAALASSLAAAAGMPAANGSRLMAWPMTPVEDGSTSAAATPSACAASSQVARASSTPPGAQVLALPLLTKMAWAQPSARCSRSTVMGAPYTLLVV